MINLMYKVCRAATLDELTEIYEKARYSNLEVTKQDIIKAKEQCR